MAKRNAFTLIELLVVIAIIGILATLVITQVASAQVRARNSSSQSDISQAGKAIEAWKVTNDSTQVIASGGTITGGNAGTTLNASTAAGNWAAVFSANVNGSYTAGNPPTGNYPVVIAKTPAASYTYGYVTDATAGNYCVATNASTSNGVTATGFSIVNGATRALTGATVTYTVPTATNAGCQ